MEPIPTVVVQDIRSYPGKVVWPALDICFWEVLDGEGIQGKGEWVGEYVHEVAWIYDFLVDLALPQRGSYRLSIVMGPIWVKIQTIRQNMRKASCSFDM